MQSYGPVQKLAVDYATPTYISILVCMHLFTYTMRVEVYLLLIILLTYVLNST